MIIMQKPKHMLKLNSKHGGFDVKSRTSQKEKNTTS